MHISLYRKYRPDTFKNLIGQEHIVRTLINQINSNTVSHAYLFTGTRGTGKTSTAKIFAKAVNCLSPIEGSPCGKCSVCVTLSNPANLDIIEMDAASNNGVEEIRELREKIQYPPSVGRYKVFIIDEVHMLTSSAFNALLKTLEEPPSHAMFILATTEIHKIPQTILSRCMRFDFRLVARDTIVGFIENILKNEGVEYERRGLELLALHGEGSVRDTLSLTDMCIAYSPRKLSYATILDVLGTSDFDTLFKLTKHILEGDITSLLALSNMIYSRGKSLTLVAKELASFLNESLTIKNVKGYDGGLSTEEYNLVTELVNAHENYRLTRAIEIITLAENQMKYSSIAKTAFDSSMVKASLISTEQSIESLMLRINDLEKKIKEITTVGIVNVKSSEEKVATATQDSVAEATEKPKNKPIIQSAVLKTGGTEQKKNNDLEAMILSFATKVEEKSVFQEEKEDDNSYTADTVFGNLLNRLKDEGESFIYFALKTQEDYQIIGNDFILYANGSASIRTLNEENSKRKIDSILKEIMNLSFVLMTKNDKAKKEDKNKLELINLFGDKFIDKSTK